MSCRRRVGRGRHALQPHRVAVAVAQVGVFERALVARRHLVHRRDEARRAREHVVVAAAAELDDGAGVERRLPRAAARQRRAPSTRAPSGASPASTRAEHRQHVRRAAFGPGERRQAVVLDVAEVGLEHLAEAVDELLGAAARCPRSRPADAPRAGRAGGSARRAARPPGAPTAPTRRRAAPRARSRVKKLPASLGAALARIVETLLRATSPSTLIERIAKTGWRASHITAIAATSDRGDVPRAPRRSRSSGARRAAMAPSSFVPRVAAAMRSGSRPAARAPNRAMRWPAAARRALRS